MFFREKLIFFYILPQNHIYDSIRLQMYMFLSITISHHGYYSTSPNPYLQIQIVEIIYILPFTTPIFLFYGQLVIYIIRNDIKDF